MMQRMFAAELREEAGILATRTRSENGRQIWPASSARTSQTYSSEGERYGSEMEFINDDMGTPKALVILVLIVSLIAPQPVRAQFGIDWAAIVAAINSIGTAIANTIGPALRAINGALGTLNQLMSSIQAFFMNIVYPQAAITRAQGWSARWEDCTRRVRRSPQSTFRAPRWRILSNSNNSCYPGTQ